MANANDWEPIGSPQATQPTAQAGQVQPVSDWEQLPVTNKDENTGEDKPATFSGTSPETAKNDGIVSFSDRLKMSFGNTVGNTAYLKTKFEDVRPIQDESGKSTQELAVLKDGSWFRVDPKNGDVFSPWDLTKSYLKDMNGLKELANDTADLTSAGMTAAVSYPITGAIAGAAVAGTIMTGGAAAPWLAPTAAVTAAAVSAAAAHTVNTSLGRLVGTYQATPQEQLWDTSFEMLLNAGMVGIAAGTKPTASVIADKWPKVAEAFKDATSAIADSPKALFKKVFASMSVGENNFDVAVENPQRLKSTMKSLYGMTGKDTAGYQDQAIREQVYNIKTIAEGTRKALTRIYGAGKRRVLASVSDDYVTNFDDAIADSYRNALSKNIGKMVTPEGRSLFGVDAVNYLDSKGIKGFEVLSQDEMKQMVNSGKTQLKDDLGYLATNKEAHKAFSSFYDEVGSFVDADPRRGKSAADELLNFKRVMADKADDIANSEHIQSMSGVKAILDDARASIDDSIVKSLEDAGPGSGEAFKALNAEYSKMRQGFAPLLQAQRRAKKTENDAVYGTLLSQFLAKPRPGAPARYMIDDAIDLAESYKLGDLAKEMKDSKMDIQVLEAAKAFNPLKASQLKASDQSNNQVGLGIYSVLKKDPTILATVTGLSLLRSPQTAKLGVALSQGAWKGKQLMQSMPKPDLEKMMSDPRYMTPFIDSIVNGPLQRASVEQDLQNHVDGQGQ